MLFHITEVIHILEKSKLDTLSWKVSYSGAFYIFETAWDRVRGNSNVKPLSDVEIFAEDY